MEGNGEKVAVTSDGCGVRLVLTSGGVMAFDEATVECLPETGKTQQKRAGGRSYLRRSKAARLEPSSSLQ